MSGSARSLQSCDFSGLRVASTYYTPAYSKNGANVNSKLEINVFMNLPNKTDQIIRLTAWGKLADGCAKSMSKGKEFAAMDCQLNVYDKRVFMPSLVQGQPGAPVLKADGSPLTYKAQSYTIGRLGYGMESDKHIAREIQENVRPLGWDVKGSVQEAQWKEILNARKAIQFDPNSPTGTFGYATIRMPQGVGIGAYIPNQTQVAQPAGLVAQPVAAALTVAPVAAAPVVAAPAVAVADPVVVASGGFVVPAGV